MPVKQLKDFLDNHHVRYTSLIHSPAFTAQEVAAAAHISGRKLAKTVIVKMDGEYAMVVLSANDHLNFERLKKVSGMHQIDLANELEFRDKFPGCEVGAMPPFGNIYGMPVYVASNVCREDTIVFSAGSHSELMQMTFNDFEQLVRPKIVALI